MTDLERTVVVVSSKSGGTVETDSHRRAFATAFADAGLDEKQVGARFVVVTDPGSPLSETAADMGARAVFLADPTVGGRYSALSAFGLVPSALAGADVGALLDAGRGARRAPDRGRQLRPRARAPSLGAAVGAGTRQAGPRRRRDGVRPAIEGFGDWAEQLIAESTGKEGRGILPVVVESADGPRRHRPGRRCWPSSAPTPRPPHRRSAVDRPARRAVPRLGVRHGRRRAGAGHQPLRPAERDREQGEHPGGSSPRASPTSRRRRRSARSRCAAAAGCSTAST